MRKFYLYLLIVSLITFSDHLDQVQGQFGWGFEQPYLVDDVPTHGMGDWNWMIFKGLFQPKPFPDSISVNFSLQY